MYSTVQQDISSIEDNITYFCTEYFSELDLATNQILQILFKQPEHLRQHAVLIDNVLLEETESTKFLGMHLDKG